MGGSPAGTGLRVRSGPWGVPEITAFLRTAVIPVRLATHGEFPLVQSLWFVYTDGCLWCATQRDSVVAQRVGRDPRVGFEVSGDAPPYRGVRGTGLAEIEASGAPAVLESLIDRYGIDRESSLGAWLLSRVDTEVALRIHSLTVTSWDYRSRMSAAR